MPMNERLKLNSLRALRTLEIVGIVAALWVSVLAIMEKKAESHNRAWQRIAQAPRIAERPVVLTNLGLGNALEVLNADHVPLKRIVLPGAWLEGVKLENADLRWSILYLSEINNAELGGALLASASFRNADLHGTNFSGADFSGTDISDAVLRGANLSDAQNLTQEQLDTACGDERTRLPPGLTIRPCS
jgi:hypothetical protein